MFLISKHLFNVIEAHNKSVPYCFKLGSFSG
uniref:Uncharacterized protein n=1 Tax=Rhizophora mucronata TaxID=61149 RepID=A0A2P2NW20_RHIMU